MPTLSNMQIPQPTGWEEFEDIVKSSLELKWNVSDLTMHGRQGQKQYGVDIYGRNNKNELSGVQCKLTVKTIDCTIIDAEISNAENFEPSLERLYIATTSPTDANLQKYVRNISESRESEGKFTVGILFWRDITQDLTKDADVVRRHFPQLFYQGSEKKLNNINLRDRDIDNLKKLLGYIDLDSINYNIEMAPRSVGSGFLFQFDIINPIVESPSFFIHNSKLNNTLFLWLNKWHEIIQIGRFSYEYVENSDFFKFPMVGDAFIDKERERVYFVMDELYKEYRSLFREFTDLINRDYPEINLVETNIMARKLGR